VNLGVFFALLAIALALIVIGWKGTYANAWHVITGRTTTFGQGSSQGSQGSQGSQSGSTSTDPAVQAAINAGLIFPGAPPEGVLGIGP
jgi:hypothetical protein